MTRVRRRHAVRAAAAGALLVAAGAAPAWADGVVVAPTDLGADGPRLLARIQRDKARNPDVWRAVAAIDDFRPEARRRSRAQRPAAVSIRLRALGAPARWALADLAAFHAPERGGASEAAWTALGVGLIDALGVAGDPALAPVLRATFDKAAGAGLASAAAVGLGKLGDAELPRLLAHARPEDPRFVAAVRGLGASRRPEATEALARLLDGAGDPLQAATVAGALAEAGSAWAWETGAVGSRADGEAVRRTAAAALVRNYPRLDGVAATEVEAAVKRVAHPEMATLVAAARRTASPDAALRLDRLLPSPAAGSGR